jgi:hypothetical protein
MVENEDKEGGARWETVMTGGDKEYGKGVFCHKNRE